MKRGEMDKGVDREIAERNGAEEALRDSEKKYRALFESAPDAVLMLALSPEHGPRVVDCNEHTLKLFRLTHRDQMLGKSPLDFSPPVQPDGQLSAEKASESVQKAIGGTPQTLEWQHVHADGTPFYAEVTISRIELKDKDYVQAIVRDVTDRKRAEQALRESEAKYRALFESAGDAVLIVDVSGEHGRRVIDCNQQTLELLGLTHRDQLGAAPAPSFAPRVQPDGRPSEEKFAELIQTVIEGHPQIVESEHVREDGTRFFLEVKLNRIELGGKFYLQAVARDITERKRAEEERLALEKKVQQAQKLESLGVLAGGIAHDFNNLLMGMLGNADLALQELPQGSPTRAKLNEIETAIRRAADLTGQMLAYSGQGKFVVERVDLRPLVEEMFHLLKVSISKKATLNFDFGGEVPPIDSDATQLRQIVMNLITNASEAIGDKTGVISIRTGSMLCDRRCLDNNLTNEDLQEGMYSYLEVADTGSGMDENTISKIFDPFFTTKFAGRGLGLAAVLGIVRAHKGALMVDSEVGKGTTFRVLFPSVKGPAAAEQRSARDIATTFKGKTVLLVDDDEAVRTVVSMMLVELGFEVVAAEDGQGALREFGASPHRFACVLMDLTMPVMDGQECLTELRRIRKDVPVILTSGYNEPESFRRLADKGAVSFIRKPYTTDQLVETLRAALKDD